MKLNELRIDQEKEISKSHMMIKVNKWIDNSDILIYSTQDEASM